MTIDQYKRALYRRLKPALGAGEARDSVRAILEDVGGYDARFLVMHSDREMLPETAARLDRVADAVIGGTPVQYATGRARFCGLDFAVTPAVLIPRPETQGLVDCIIDRWKSRPDLRVLDLGTGSGCIAVALARSLKFAEVTAIDLSEAALAVARSNARQLGAKVAMHRADMTRPDTLPPGPFDVIVSNPPYIAPDEADAMDSRVLHYEPMEALFVPADDPLLFYRAIARYGRDALAPGGMLYLEINPRFAAETEALLRSEGFSDTEVLPDYLGRKRFITACL